MRCPLLPLLLLDHCGKVMYEKRENIVWQDGRTEED